MDSTLEILGPADVCLRIGPNLCARYKDIRGANRRLDTLDDRMENVWISIEPRLVAVRWFPGVVPSAQRVHMMEHLHQLQLLLHTSYKTLEKVTRKNGWTPAQTIKFALFQKRSLGKDVSALEKWRDTFASTFPTLSIPQNPEPESFQYE
ncbi:hypothetical protein HOY80DRAFT_1134046 [Tuber brumale]|nr:hypothetical protein HOY80DRAFT_1134046 [Tuber brumale]